QRLHRDPVMRSSHVAGAALLVRQVHRTRLVVRSVDVVLRESGMPQVPAVARQPKERAPKVAHRLTTQLGVRAGHRLAGNRERNVLLTPTNEPLIEPTDPVPQAS